MMVGKTGEYISSFNDELTNIKYPIHPDNAHIIILPINISSPPIFAVILNLPAFLTIKQKLIQAAVQKFLEVKAV